MIELFQRLGDALDRAWRAEDYDEAAFPELATALLAEHAPYRALDARDVARDVCAGAGWVQQINLESGFGEPPVAVYAHDRFYIEVLYWIDGTTAIHQHGFSGAFQVLAGSSIEAIYRFEGERRVSSRLALGRTVLEDVRLLTRGTTQPIRSGDAFIHSLFHLDRPSLTVVARTHSDELGRPQLNYLRPGIGYDPYHVPEVLRKQLSLVSHLGRTGDPGHLAALRRLVVGRDPETALRALLLNHGFLDGARLTALIDELGAGGEAEARLGALLPPALAERARQRRIVEHRARAVAPDERFLLAVLLNVPTWRQAAALTEARLPGRPARAALEEAAHSAGVELAFEG